MKCLVIILTGVAFIICMNFEKIAYASENIPGQGQKLRYFMQPTNIKGSSTPYGDNPVAGRYVQSDDAKIYYEVYGDGKPIFVFQGGGVGSPYELGNVIDMLRKRFKVIVASTRGHGRSEIGHTPLTYAQKANDMLAVMKKNSNCAAPIFGFSDGAYTAYKLASMYPEAVERIVALGAGTLKTGYFPATMSVASLEKRDKKYVEQMKRLMPEPQRLQEFLNNYMAFWNKMSVGKELFNSIKCPVLLIVGDEDDHAPVKTVLEAHQMIQNSRLCVVPKAWHTAFLDNFPIVSLATSQFMDADLSSLVSSKKVKQNSF